MERKLKGTLKNAFYKVPIFKIIYTKTDKRSKNFEVLLNFKYYVIQSLMPEETRWLYCVECPQYIRLKALGYM